MTEQTCLCRTVHDRRNDKYHINDTHCPIHNSESERLEDKENSEENNALSDNP